ncbi:MULTISPECIES: BMC domain-containing protein [Vagococcus]|uniref:Ethanolamine utilization protein similar to PduU n=1 Tax=Vagococcus fluvialis bH819 TaxID=1255619 RepID=A0A1X6WPK8_9ENTE|nr:MULTISPECIES: BMC domain-containing protein [Vagococcus]SLM86198.1 Ethanolamine utilization protein similar to PduU [Vagococcus fluvialis bH819]HCM89710.1 BMC domain-containing protein [Vagococcus sp.]
MSEKMRVIQESVPGRQITIAHVIASPDQRVYEKIGLFDCEREALGILTITPGEAAIVAADVASKAAAVKVAFMDRFSGTVVLAGDVTAVEASMEMVNQTLNELLHISSTPVTKS